MLNNHAAVLVASMLTAAVFAPAIVPVVMWLSVVAAANLTWKKTRPTSRTLTLAAVVTPAVWVMPLVAAVGVLVAWAFSRQLRAAAKKRYSGQSLATGVTSV